MHVLYGPVYQQLINDFSLIIADLEAVLFADETSLFLMDKSYDRLVSRNLDQELINLTGLYV